MNKLQVIFIITALAVTCSGLAAQTSGTGLPWDGRWGSSPAACQKVTCSGDADCDGTAYSFEGEIFRGVPGYFVCVIAAQSSDKDGDTILPLACAAEGRPYTTAIRLRLKKDALMVEWAGEPSSNADAYEFTGDAIDLMKCPK